MVNKWLTPPSAAGRKVKIAFIYRSQFSRFSEKFAVAQRKSGAFQSMSLRLRGEALYNHRAPPPKSGLPANGPGVDTT
jgi:hypothetical protein